MVIVGRSARIFFARKSYSSSKDQKKPTPTGREKNAKKKKLEVSEANPTAKVHF